MWSLTWLILPIISILVVGFATWGIIKGIKKHKVKQKAPAVSQKTGKVKEQKLVKEKSRQKNVSKTTKQTRTNSKPSQTVKPRNQDEQQSNSTSDNKKAKITLPRFDIQDAKMVAQDKEKFLKHQKLYFKQHKTSEEVKEFEKLNDYFDKTYGHIPNQNLPADYTQKTSGFYCFNGKGSQNFKNYCESTTYDKKQDNGDRLIVQVDCGSNRPKLSFCINPNNKDMLNAVMVDIDSTVAAINATNAVVNMATIEQGKFKVLPEKSYKEFCKKDEKNASVTKQETPELSK